MRVCETSPGGAQTYVREPKKRPKNNNKDPIFVNKKSLKEGFTNVHECFKQT